MAAAPQFPPLEEGDSKEEPSKESRGSDVRTGNNGSQHNGDIVHDPEEQPDTAESSEKTEETQSVWSLVLVTIGLCLAIFCVSMVGVVLLAS